MISNIPRRNCSNDSTWWKSKQPSICKEGNGGEKSLVIQERELVFKNINKWRNLRERGNKRGFGPSSYFAAVEEWQRSTWTDKSLWNPQIYWFFHCLWFIIQTIVFDLSYKLLASGQLKDHVPGVPKCEDGEEESEKEQSQNIYKAGGLHLMGIGADGHGGCVVEQELFYENAMMLVRWSGGKVYKYVKRNSASLLICQSLCPLGYYPSSQKGSRLICSWKCQQGFSPKLCDISSLLASVFHSRCYRQRFKQNKNCFGGSSRFHRVAATFASDALRHYVGDWALGNVDHDM